MHRRAKQPLIRAYLSRWRSGKVWSVRIATTISVFYRPETWHQRCCTTQPTNPSAFALSSGKRTKLSFVGMDGFGIVYLIENAQEFWSGALCATLTCTQPWLTLKTELDDILKIPENASLSLLDATLKRSLTFCASYHGALWRCGGPLPACLVLTLGTCRTIFTESFTT